MATLFSICLSCFSVCHKQWIFQVFCSYSCFAYFFVLFWTQFFLSILDQLCISFVFFSNTYLFNILFPYFGYTIIFLAFYFSVELSYCSFASYISLFLCFSRFLFQITYRLRRGKTVSVVLQLKKIRRIS